ncbi:MAG: hypothetical protein ACLTYL_11695 [Faecalibacterium sp.]
MTFSNVSFGDVTDNFDKKGFHYRQPNEKKDKENIGIMGRKE